MKKLVTLLILINVAYFLWYIRSQQDSVHISVDASNAPSLVLLSEVPGTPTLAVDQNSNSLSDESAATPIPSPTPISISSPTQPPVGEQTVSEPSPILHCMVLGGFVDQDGSEKAITFLSNQGIKADLKIVETREEGNYLIYLPPYESREAALAKLRELKAQSIDSFVIGDGEHVNGISLGVFSKEESALKMQSQLKAKGYDVQMSRNARIYRQYVLQVISTDALTEAVLADLSARYANGKLTRETQTCH